MEAEAQEVAQVQEALRHQQLGLRQELQGLLGSEDHTDQQAEPTCTRRLRAQ